MTQLALALSSEVLQPTNDFCDSLDLVYDFSGDVADRRSGLSFLCRRFQDAAISRDGLQRLVNFVSDSGDHLAHRAEASDVEKLVLLFVDPSLAF